MHFILRFLMYALIIGLSTNTRNRPYGAQRADRDEGSMKTKFDIAVFDGDGIGPEIMRPTVDIL
ncbi:hypothetical protein, partial [Pseudooctadecabacter sp.]|uniref:hypothetical protein n=1 Tax=Pseudooctadecabacter sp. TaxID=1966338 RepID=UPI0035C7A9C9